MFPYWAMFLVLAIPALASHLNVRQRINAAWFFTFVLLSLFIGFRDWVGADWPAYLRHLQEARFLDFGEVFLQSDPGYVLLNWLANRLGFEIYFVNLLCGAIFSIGVIAFARRQPYPWVALAVAFPYLIVVVAMGYSRQGVSIGLILLALNALQMRKIVPYLVWIALATIFHRTALIMLPLGLFLWGRGWLVRAVTVITAAFVLFDLLVVEEVDQLWANYVDAEMQSQGARIRVAMNVVPSVILLWFWKTWRRTFPDYWFWFWIAAGSVLCLLLVGFASTAVDRMALYFLPIQLVVFSRLPFFLRAWINPNTLKFGIVLGYALVLYVWLNFAHHAFAWVPYRNVLFL